ncbi:unnamed protein product [Adineta steineri]|uniref:TLDc domain-containing protein n=1 Tax=Adineta steineri TaxID=433720 RepID=A0A814L2R7_9BILA|nr:unnamed protein product [Adineta steineri]CAF4153435.1 unnamed protein product [Adineta steineri]
MAASSKVSDIAIKLCEIESCQRASATLCHHCKKDVCRRHFNEHADQLVQELNPLADNVNKLREKISSFGIKEYKQKELDKLIQWRDEAINNINDLFELKKQKLNLLFQDNEEIFLQQTAGHLEVINKLTNETANFVEESDVTFEQLLILKQQLHALEDRISETHNRLVYCDIKPLLVDYNLVLLHSASNNYMRGGTLLCADYQMRLNDFYGNARQKWELIYKGTKDGFRGEDFHRCSDDKGPTMTIIQTKNNNYLFGGYVKISWGCDNKYKRDSTAFLFTLANAYAIQPTKFSKKFNGTFSVCHDDEIGPHFGGVVRDKEHFCDFQICSNAHKLKQSSSDFPAAYIDTTGKGETLFAGEKNFLVEEIEVYKLADESKDKSENNDKNESNK